jgi:hypothetical protein
VVDQLSKLQRVRIVSARLGPSLILSRTMQSSRRIMKKR